MNEISYWASHIVHAILNLNGTQPRRTIWMATLARSINAGAAAPTANPDRCADLAVADAVRQGLKSPVSGAMNAQQNEETVPTS